MIKQVIVMRRDLKMRKGKIAAQAGHAVLGAYLATINKPNHPNWIDEWLKNSFTKICLYVDSEEEILALANKAAELNIVYAVITDNGTTEFHGVPTITCIGFEPLPEELIDPITGDLPLY